MKQKKKASEYITKTRLKQSACLRKRNIEIGVNKNKKKDQSTKPLSVSKANMAVQRLGLVWKKNRNMLTKQKFSSIKFSAPKQDS